MLPKSRFRRREKGAVLVLFAVAVVVLIASVGLAVDVGRMYVVRTEAQSFVDALALARAAEIVGARAPDGSDVWKRYDFDRETFGGAGVVLQYSAGSSFSAGTFTTSPDSGTMYVRARATVPVPLSFLPVLVAERSRMVSAEAVAGLERITVMGAGAFPYAVRGGAGGLVKGEQYTFRWGNNVAKDVEDAWRYVNNNMSEAPLETRLAATATVLGGGNPIPGRNPPNISTWCSGNATAQFVTALYYLDPFENGVSQDLFSWTGAYFQGGTREIMDAMAGGYQDQVVEEGGQISVATGVRQATQQELRRMINYDTNQTTNDPDLYDSVDPRNSRLIFSPVVSSVETAFLRPGAGASATVGAIEAFLLLVPTGAYGNPGENWCAVYAGAREGGSGVPVNHGSGVWVLRLVQ